MQVSYNKLWKLLIDKNMNKMELRKKAGLSTGTMAKLGKNESVTTKVLVKICEELQCDVADIMEIIPNAESEQNEKE
ncbi:helix-turn-helix transcriptional regulator [Solobacterium moorei]|uniref:helix-turn-helix domain-containing protein n=1 Tax=Solobacterium moorei TaxID=102148 RepID=UPI0023F54AAF|nr:helix-turn-helix transcriptional regulator [Solobacterium moorei]